MGATGPGRTPAHDLAERVRAEQRRRWRQGERPPAEELLAAHPALHAEPELVLEVIYNEVLLREELGEPPQPDEYVRRFPQHARELRLQFEVHAAMRAELASAPDGSAVAAEDAATLRRGGGPLPASRPPCPSVPGYDVLRELGRGGMGVVYLARQVRLRRLVALKMILAGRHAGPDAVARFLREAEAVAAVQHPNIVHIYEIGDVDGLPFLALEYVAGGSLEALLAGKPLAPRVAAHLVRTLAQAVHYAHQQGVVHRDLKPANVLLQRSEVGDQKSEVRGQKSEVRERAGAVLTSDLRPLTSGLRPLTSDLCPKITDFGLAKLFLAEAPGLTRSNDLLGTPSYMAPEQTAARAGDIGPAVDVYALGAILYQLLTGRPPFLADTPWATVLQVQHEEPLSPSRLQSRTPRDLVTICLKCLRKEPRQRYATAQALADDLGRFLENKPIHARPVGTLERAAKWARRRPAVAGLLLGIALVTLAGVAGITAMWLHAEQRRAEAERARGREAEARGAETEQRHAAEARAYFDRLGRVHQAWLALRGDRAEQLLQQCREQSPGLCHWEWDYLNKLCHSDLLTLPGHTTEVAGVTYSPDGNLLASCSGSWNGRQPGEVIVWDAATGRPLETFRGHKAAVYRVAFHPGGRLLASASIDGTARLWDLDQPRAEGAPLAHGVGVFAVAFHPNGRRLATAGGDGRVYLWDLETRQVAFALAGHAETVLDLAFHPDGRRLASVGRDGSVFLWDLEARRAVRQEWHTNDCRRVAISPDGRLLAAGAFEGSVRLWDLTRASSAPVLLGLNLGAIGGLTFSPDGLYLAVSTSAGGARVLSLPGGRVWFTVRGHAGAVSGAAFHPDGRRLATAGQDRLVKVWDVTNYKEPLALGLIHGGWIVSLALNPADPDLVALAGGENRSRPAGRDPSVKLVRLRTGKVEGARFAGHEKWLTAVAFSADGRHLATASEDQTARLWDVAGRRAEHVLRGHTAAVTGVAYDPTGRRLATSSADRTARLWDTAAGHCERSLEGHTGAVNGVAWSADGSLVATAGADRTVRIWSAADGRQRWCFTGHQGAVTAVVFSPTEPVLASADAEQVHLWDVATGEELTAGSPLLVGRPTEAEDAPPTTQPEGQFLRLGFSPDGRRLVTAGPGRPLQLWDVASREEALLMHGPPEKFLAVAFSPDRRRLVAASGENLIVWDTERARAADDGADEKAVRAWHETEGSRATTLDHWFATVFHASRVLPLHPDDPGRWHFRRGRALAHLGQPERAAPDLERAIELQPKVGRTWRADLYAELEQWDPALADFAEAQRREPANLSHNYNLAIAHLGRGDLEAYRTVGAKLMKQFERAPTSGNAFTVLYALAPLAGKVAEGMTLQAVGRRAGLDVNRPMIAAHYRAGDDRLAVETFRNLGTNARRRGWDLLFLAMAHHRLKQSGEAEAYLLQARAWIDQAEQAWTEQWEKPGPRWFDWRERVEVLTLRREAEALLRQPP